MTKFVAIISGKGGVGKTTSAINLATALSGFGRDVLVLDANLKTPNVNLHLGSPNTPITLHDALQGKYHITDAAYLHPSGLKVIPASLALEKVDSVEPAKLAEVLLDLEGACEAVFLDTKTGIDEDVEHAIRAADEAIVVTNPDLPSVTDALKAIRLADKVGVNVVGVIVNRFKNDSFDMSLDNIRDLLDKPIIGVVPEDENVRKSIAVRHPVVYTHPDSKASVAFKELAAKLSGQKYVHSIKESKDTPSKLHQVLKKLGLNK
jgi:septum site-determining protein MinD